MRCLLIGLLTLLAACTGLADLRSGTVYALKMLDVDGRTLSTAQGMTTVLVLAASGEVDKASVVGDRIPERCLGNPAYRMITVVELDRSWGRRLPFFSNAMIRRRLDAVANRLKPRYEAKHLNRNPRGDVYAVADFDGRIVSQLGLKGDATPFRVLVVGGDGTLLRDWTEVPSQQELASAIP